MRIDLVWVDELIGSADGLRAVSDRIRGDFICLGSDLVSQFSFGEIAQLHRLRAADVTMLLCSATVEESEKKGCIKKLRIDEEDQEYIGICGDGRVVVKKPALEVDEGFTLLKPLINRCSSPVTLRNDLLDMGVYMMSHWVLNLLMENKAISSIRTELVPFIVDRQFQTATYLSANIPALSYRKNLLNSVDKWLADIDTTGISTVIASNETLKNTSMITSTTHCNKGPLELVDYLYADMNKSTRNDLGDTANQGNSNF